MTQSCDVAWWPRIAHGFARKYDFDAWADGQPHELVRGLDYDADNRRFYKAAWAWADRKGYRLTFRTLSKRRCELRMVAA
jgi:hypothetical protein